VVERWTINCFTHSTSLNIARKDPVWSAEYASGYGPVKTLIPTLKPGSENLFMVMGRTGEVLTLAQSSTTPVLTVGITPGSASLLSARLSDTSIYNSSSYGRREHSVMGYCYTLRTMGLNSKACVVLADVDKDGFLDYVDEPDATAFENMYGDPEAWL
jgi:hypothetical protein